MTSLQVTPSSTETSEEEEEGGERRGRQEERGKERRGVGGGWKGIGGTVMGDRWVFFPWGVAAKSGKVCCIYIYLYR